MWFRKSPCRFCCLKSLNATNRVVYEDALVIGIQDRHPRAQQHLLVISKEHIASVDALEAAHYPLLQHMIQTGREMLIQAQSDLTNDNIRLGFHRPPFASIGHLHLHCLGLPFDPWWNEWRYRETIIQSYVDAERVLNTLRS